MTMTDTEAKALALVNEAAGGQVNQYLAVNRSASVVNEALCRAIEREEATEARHAAELRELKERFSEAVNEALEYDFPNRSTIEACFSSFILPSPDPLKSWLHKSGYEGNPVVEQALADIAHNGGKIVWEAGE